jgi:hypothetical protein
LIMHKQLRPAKTAAPLVACTDTQNKVRVVCDVLWVVVGRRGGGGGGWLTWPVTKQRKYVVESIHTQGSEHSWLRAES